MSEHLTAEFLSFLLALFSVVHCFKLSLFSVLRYVMFCLNPY